MFNPLQAPEVAVVAVLVWQLQPVPSTMVAPVEEVWVY
jgi:hypothetical protein